nr:cytochrome P450 [Rhodococcus sp. (in: high G+C Gram-positive bacteria)]
MSSATEFEQTPLYQEADEIARLLLSDPPDDPYPLYNRLREISPVHRVSTTGDWVVSGYDVLTEALRDPRFTRDFDDLMKRQHDGDVDYSRPIIKHRISQFSHANPPTYMKKRAVLTKSITPTAVKKLSDEIEGYVNELLDAAEAQGQTDMVKNFSNALTLKLISRVLGFPSPEGDPAWLRAFAPVGHTFRTSITEEMLVEADEAILSLNPVITEQIEKVRANPSSPGDTMVTQVLQAQAEGAPLTDDDIVANTIFMFGGAFHTSAALISNAILTLMQHRDQWDLLVSDPETHAKGAVEETLRFDTAVLSNPPSRLAVEDVELGGFTIPAGSIMIPLYAAANHDPLRYEDPETFDITRKDIRPLSFGGGPHVCPGQHLARHQTIIALRILASRFPDMKLAAEDPPRVIMPLQREVGELQVRFA